MHSQNRPKRAYSIIIPTLNEEILLPRLLSQLQNQTFQNFEVCVVDAKSEDDTVKIAKTFLEKMDLQVFESPKRGVSFQKNFGADHTNGKFLIFLDADIEVYPTFLSELDTALTEGGYLSVAANWWRYPGIPLWEKVIMFLGWETSFLTQYIGKPIGGAGVIIVERNIFEKIGKFDENVKIAEDCQVLQKLKDRGIRTKYLRKPAVHISQRRIKKDGLPHVLWLYAKSTYFQIRGGDHARYEADYQMGGQYHGKYNN